jgi:hypothetical protein
MKRLLLIATALAATTAANAADMTVRYVNNVPTVFIAGKIETRDYAQFENLTARIPANKGLVVLDSPGGNLSDGLNIGLLIRQKRMATVVYDQCVSVCALMWLAGVTRGVSTEAGIGFHAAWFLEDGKKVPSSAGNAVVGGYLMQLGFGYAAIESLTQAGPEDVEWLDDAKAKQYGIKVTVFTPKQSKQPQQAKQDDDPNGMKKWCEPTSNKAAACQPYQTTGSTNPYVDAPSKDKEALGFLAALTIHYQRCGGQVTKEQNAAIHPILYWLGSEVGKAARTIEKEKCPAIKSAFQSLLRQLKG